MAAGAAVGIAASWVKAVSEPRLQRLFERLVRPTEREKELVGADPSGHLDQMPPAELADRLARRRAVAPAAHLGSQPGALQLRHGYRHGVRGCGGRLAGRATRSRLARGHRYLRVHAQQRPAHHPDPGAAVEAARVGGTVGGHLAPAVRVRPRGLRRALAAASAAPAGSRPGTRRRHRGGRAVEDARARVAASVTWKKPRRSVGHDRGIGAGARLRRRPYRLRA